VFLEMGGEIMRVLIRLTIALVCASLLSPPVAGAVDEPFANAKLVMKRSASGSVTVRFVAEDPNLVFPAVGGPDDPSDVGMAIELFSPSQLLPGSSLAVPPGAGPPPGWKRRDATVDAYVWMHPGAPGPPSPVARVVVKQGRLLRFVARDAAGLLDSPQSRVGIRITTGSIRHCAVFDGASIRISVPGRFVAEATSSTLADCSNSSLLGSVDCCRAHAGSGCDEPACEVDVCTGLGHSGCCSGTWDDLCAVEASTVCEVCGPAPNALRTVPRGRRARASSTVALSIAAAASASSGALSSEMRRRCARARRGRHPGVEAGSSAAPSRATAMPR
jgi:hypothetical protein